MTFSLYGNTEARPFNIGDRVKRADGMAGVITATTQRRKGKPEQVEAKWDRSGSKKHPSHRRVVPRMKAFS